MPHSEIDDIFATSKAADKPAKLHSASQPSKKKRKRDAAREREATLDSADARPSKRKAPETVLDPSMTTATKPPKAGNFQAPKKKHRNQEDEERFKDSRGTGPRRKTEEGFAIYKEDELGINDQAGDTPLCPFDCQCCF